jgi:hypothetical protein
MLHIIKIYWKKYPDSLGPQKKPVPNRSQNHPSMQRPEVLTSFPESKKQKPVPKRLMLHIIKIYWKRYFRC